MGQRDRQTERERETDKDRQTQRERQTDRDTEGEKQRGREGDRKTDRQRERGRIVLTRNCCTMQCDHSVWPASKNEG